MRMGYDRTFAHVDAAATNRDESLPQLLSFEPQALYFDKVKNIRNTRCSSGGDFDRAGF